MRSTRSAPRSSPRGASRVSLAWLAMFAVALGLRVACTWIMVGPNGTPAEEAAEFDHLAWNLARGAGLSHESPAGLQPTARVAPAVPWLVSLLYQSVGHRYFLAVLLQCLVGALVPLLVAALGRSLFGDPAGRWGGWVAAIHPALVIESARLRAETAFAAALLLALCLSAAWVRTPRVGRALGLGLAWGAAILTMPAAAALPALIAAWAWRPLGLTVDGRSRVTQLGLLLVGLAAAVSPWTLRNAAALRAFVPVTTGAGRALLMGNNPEAWDDPALRGGPAAADAGGAGELGGPSEAEADARAGARAWAFARGRVAEWPAIAAAKLARFWRPGQGDGGSGPGARASVAPSGRVGLDPLVLWWIVSLPCALWGVARALSGARRWFQALPLLVILYFMTVAVVFFGSPRARLPVEPLLALLAALGLADVWRRRRARRGRLALVPRSGGGGESPERGSFQVSAPGCSPP